MNFCSPELLIPVDLFISIVFDCYYIWSWSTGWVEWFDGATFRIPTLRFVLLLWITVPFSTVGLLFPLHYNSVVLRSDVVFWLLDSVDSFHGLPYIVVEIVVLTFSICYVVVTFIVIYSCPIVPVIITDCYDIDGRRCCTMIRRCWYCSLLLLKIHELLEELPVTGDHCCSSVENCWYSFVVTVVLVVIIILLLPWYFVVLTVWWRLPVHYDILVLVTGGIIDWRNLWCVICCPSDLFENLEGIPLLCCWSIPNCWWHSILFNWWCTFWEVTCITEADHYLQWKALRPFGVILFWSVVSQCDAVWSCWLYSVLLFHWPEGR